jgi:hypothetical protein
MNIDTILTVKNEHLMSLGIEGAVDFFRELLWAEVTRIGIPIHKVNVSSWVNVPDGGVDASVESDALTQPSFIRNGRNSYQVKAGSDFFPWQKSQIKRALFGKKSPDKENLGSSVKACLDGNGIYALVCFGQDLTEQQRRKATGHLEYYFKECGYGNPQVDVWSLNNLISFIRPFPALALRANRRYQLKFETHQEWATQGEMRKGFVIGEQQEALISNLRTELRHNEGTVLIQIWGEAGIGKTRLVLEATDTDDLRPLVIYCVASHFLNSDLMTEILRGESQAILILDECDPSTRAPIWDRFQYHSPRVKLVSIYNERDNSSGISYLDVPPLGEEQTSSIIQEYGVPKDRSVMWARECSGSPRVAHMVGFNLINHPDDLLKSPSEVNIWERCIAGPDNPRSQEVQQRQTVLRHIALFKRFGYGRSLVTEAQAVAGWVQQADPQITWTRFQEIVKGLRDRKILQGENTLYITPKLLHIKLWIDWWDTYGDGFSLESLASLPPSLLNWFLEMFEYAAGSPVASQIVRSLLGKQGLFQQSPELLRGGLGARFFRFLAEADPEGALECLKGTVGTWSKDVLLQFTTGRREVVWALEEIARWRNLFKDAARLLLALGEAENETWSNNASGVFVDLFSISEHRELSRTGASPQERFPVLKEALESQSQERRLLALRACSQALGRVFWGPVIDSPRIVGRSPDLWAPTTYGEMFDAYRQVWSYLFARVDDLPEIERREAVDILLRNARPLGWVGDLSSMVIDTVNELVQRPYVDKKRVLEIVVQILHYDGSRLPEETRKGWEELRDKLTGTDFASLVERYVGMNILEDRFDENGVQVDHLQPKIVDLAQQVVENPGLLRPELGWLVTSEAQNGYQFGYEIGKRDEQLSLLPVITEAQENVTSNASGYFFGGYLRALFEKDEQAWEDLLDSFSQDERLRVWVPELTWRTGQLSDKAALRILGLARNGIAGIGHFQMFVYGGVIRELSETIFKEWIEFLLPHPDTYATCIALALYSHYYLAAEARHRLPEELTLRLLTSPSLFQESEVFRQDQMASYHWTSIGKAFVKLYPARNLELADIMLEHFGEGGTIFADFRSTTRSVLDEILQLYPLETGRRILEYMIPPMDLRAYHIKDWLRGEDFWDREQEGALSLIPMEVVWEWVDEDVDNRAWYLASFVPKVLFREENKVCWAREILVRYGEREDVRRNLMANFSTEGWSGNESSHLQNKKRQLLDFREGEENERVRQWIDEYVTELNMRIERARIEEEREDF